MGAAFVVENEPDLSAYTATEYWPSSTRAEIVAIFIALLTAPIQANIRIHTDSLSAIRALQNNQIDHTRHWLRKTNALWIAKIGAIIKEKQLKVEYVKVKGHSGNEYNDIADSLAKEGGSQSIVNLVNSFEHNIKHLFFFPFYFNIPIEQKLRKFVGSMFQSHACSE